MQARLSSNLTLQATAERDSEWRKKMKMWTVADLKQELQKYPEHAVVQFSDYEVVEAMENGKCKVLPTVTVQRVIQRECLDASSMEQRKVVIIATTGVFTLLAD
jgi:hypothetical protein